MARTPKTPFPKAIEGEYFRLIRDSFRDWYSETLRKLSPVTGYKLDDEAINREIGEARSRWNSAVEKLGIRKIGQQVKNFNQSGFARQVKSFFKIEFNPFETGFDREIDDFVTQNVALVKDIGDQEARRLQAILTDAVKDNSPESKIREEIRDRLRISENRAARIARDQVGKINMRITKIRHEKFGIEEYIWDTQKDAKVRDKHRARQDRSFRWDSPPDGGHPGEDINCRCTPRPKFRKGVKGLLQRARVASGV